MNEQARHIEERPATRAFNSQAPVFDNLYGTDTIIHYKRVRVRQHMEKWLKEGSHILELNAGTGEDAIYFAKKGHHVHATDISEKMQEQLVAKVQKHPLQAFITNECCSFTELENLRHQGPYDHIFSNFAGLNCTARLGKVLDSFYHLLKPGGYATLVLLPRFCLWESLLVFRGKFRTALRRFAGRKGARAHIEGNFFRCFYYNPSFVRKHLSETFDVVALEGLCTLVPPSYIENFAEKYPRLYNFLLRKENSLKSRWPWKLIGDYYIITLKRR